MKREASKKMRELLVVARQEYLASQGIRHSLDTIRRSKEMREIIAALETRQRSPNSAKARALVELGRRDASWTFAIGETPKTRVRGAKPKTKRRK